MPKGGLGGERNQRVHEGFDQALEVADVDTSPTTGVLTLSLSCTKCVLDLKRTEGLTFQTGDGYQDTAVVANGTARALNAALRDLRYTALVSASPI